MGVNPKAGTGCVSGCTVCNVWLHPSYFILDTAAGVLFHYGMKTEK